MLKALQWRIKISISFLPWFIWLNILDALTFPKQAAWVTGRGNFFPPMTPSTMGRYAFSPAGEALKHWREAGVRWFSKNGLQSYKEIQTLVWDLGEEIHKNRKLVRSLLWLFLFYLEDLEQSIFLLLCKKLILTSSWTLFCSLINSCWVESGTIGSC